MNLIAEFVLTSEGTLFPVGTLVPVNILAPVETLAPEGTLVTLLVRLSVGVRRDVLLPATAVIHLRLPTIRLTMWRPSHWTPSTSPVPALGSARTARRFA